MRTDDLPAIKRRLGIPRGLQSCHTVVVAGYVVEGHVPASSVARLLGQRPPVRGIALPGMPPGSPGMGGRQTGPLVVYAVLDDGVREFSRH